MRIILRKLKWNYFFSYGADNVLDFTSNTVTQILGTNGVGKSSIPLILEELLYNKNSKGIKKADIPNRLSDGKCWGSVEFTVDDNLYIVDVDRGSTVKVKLTKNGEDISSHTATNTYKTIEDIIGHDFKTFSQLIYQSTNSSLQFLTATDGARKSFFVELLTLQDYIEDGERFKEWAKATSKEVTELESRLATISGWLLKNRVDDLGKMPEVDIGVIPEELLEDQATIKSEIARVQQTNAAINLNEAKRLKYETFVVPDCPVVAVEDYSDIIKEHTIIVSERDRLKANIARLSKLSGKCNSCGQPIDITQETSMLEDAKSNLPAMEERAHQLSIDIAHHKEIEAKVVKHKAAVVEKEKLGAGIDHEMSTHTVDLLDLMTKQKIVEAKINAIRSSIEDSKSLNRIAMAHNAKVDSYLSQKESLEIEKDESSIALVEAKYVASIAETLKKACGPQGLLAYKIENLVKDLEAKVCEYLERMSDGRFTIQFSVENDKLNVNLTDNGVVIDINALSSGELSRVNISTLLAIRDLMAARNYINVLFLDEIISVLDADGKEKLVEVLSEEHNLNVFLVSHNWSHPLVEKLEINKIDGFSEIGES